MIYLSTLYSEPRICLRDLIPYQSAICLKLARAGLNFKCSRNQSCLSKKYPTTGPQFESQIPSVRLLRLYERDEVRILHGHLAANPDYTTRSHVFMGLMYFGHNPFIYGNKDNRGYLAIWGSQSERAISDHLSKEFSDEAAICSRVRKGKKTTGYENVFIAK